MKFIKCGVTLLTILMAAAPSHAELIPAARLTNWTPGVRAGVVGGIPTARTRLIDVTKAPYNVDNTGHSNAGAAINAAIGAAVANDVVYLPAGTYKLEVGLTIGQAKDYVTLRGAGMGQTILAVQPGVWTPIQIGTGFAFNSPADGVPIVGGNHKDSTVLTMPSTGDFAVNSTILLMFEEQRNEQAIRSGAVPIASVVGFNYADNQSPLIQVSKVVSKTPTTITIFPPIIRQHDAGLAAKAFSSPWNNAGIGVEDFTLDCSAGDVFAGVYMQNANDCWIKGVKIIQPSNYGIYLQSCVNSEVRKSDIRTRKGNGTNGSGILVNGTSSSLFEDNIVCDIFPNLEVNQGSNGNVFAYNLFENSPKNGYLFETVFTNHGPHNTHNLYEGNITASVKSDGYFGGSSEDTLFRNWLHGTYLQKDKFMYAVSLNRFTRNYSFIGNILGTGATPSGGSPYSMGNPNIGNGAFDGTASPSSGDFWVNWNTTASLILRSSDTAGTIAVSGGTLHPDTSTAYPQYIALRLASNGKIAANVQATLQTGNIISFSSASAPLPPAGTALTVWWGSAGYQEKDLDVAATTLLKANYNAVAGSIATNEGLGGDAMPSSLYLQSKPAWFGSLAWPAINSLAPHAAITASGSGNLSAAYKTIPAGYRFVTGEDPVTGAAIPAESPPPGPTPPADAPSANIPVITSQPTAQNIVSGGTASFSVTSSNAASYQWQKNGINIPGWNSATLSLAGATSNDAGIYSVVISNASGAITSNAVALTVSAPPASITPPTSGVTPPPTGVPVIILHPVSQTVTTSSTAVLSVIATDASTYQWQRNGINIAGWTSATLSMEGASSNDQGVYRAVVSNIHGSVTSNPATLTVVANTPAPTTPLPAPSATAPVITVQPVSQSVLVSSTTTLSVVATDALTYQWQKNGVNIGWNTATLTLASPTTNDSGFYTVIVANSSGSTLSNPAQLTVTAGVTTPVPPPPAVVLPPVITGQPTSHSAVLSTTAIFSVLASDAVSYQWRKNGTNIPNATASTLIINEVKTNDAAFYTVLVSNPGGSVTSSAAQLTVTTPVIPPAPVVPAPSPVVASPSPVTPSPSPVTPSPSPVTPTPSPVTPTPSLEAPGIVVHPETQTIISSATASFRVSATNAVNYQWKKNGTNIPGWNSATLSLPAATTNDTGIYSVVVSNSAGSTTSNVAFLTVGTLPVINTQPLGTSAISAGNVSFTIAAQAIPAPTFQWRKNGVPLVGQTDQKLTLTNIQPSLAGTYSVVVSNAYGSVTSAGAELLVNRIGIAGSYFGTFSDGGTWALHVRPDFTASYLAYLPNKYAIVTDLVIAPDGTFSVSGNTLASSPAKAASTPGQPNTAQAALPFVFTGQLSNGQLLGQLSNQMVSGSVDQGSSASVGFYKATALLADTGTTYSIIGPSGKAVVVTMTSTTVDGATGTMGNDNRFSAMTSSGAELAVTLTESRSIAVTYSQTASSSKMNFSGLKDTVRSTSALSNLSIRSTAGTGAETLIVGFAVAGGNKPILVRGIGPGLAAFNVPDTLPDPRLDLNQGAGASSVGTNDNWDARASDTFARVGAFGLPSESKDAAIVTTLGANTYTAKLTDADGASGIALVELYDTEMDNGAKLVNVSARTQVGTGGGVLIAGFNVSGTGPRTLLIRAVGPTLEAFGVTGALADPKLELYSSGTVEPVASNDNWDASNGAAFAQVGAFNLVSASRDAVLLVTVNPGTYTAKVSGVNDTTGVALIEVYEMP